MTQPEKESELPVIIDVKLWAISDVYIDYLKTFESKILFNKPEKHSRPYIGVTAKINNHIYLIPLSSFKQTKKVSSQMAMKILDITNPNEVLAYIFFNNMIPVYFATKKYIILQRKVHNSAAIFIFSLFLIMHVLIDNFVQ